MKKSFRIHVLGLPHTITNEDFVACAYTQKAWKFCKMMAGRGHTIYHYGHEDSDTMADEDVTVITNKVWEEVYGTHDYKSKWFRYDVNDKAYQTFYRNTIEEIGKRKQPGDIVLPFWGPGVRPICDAHSDLLIIEPGIGYAGGHWAPYKIFESYAIYHAYCGLHSVGTCVQNSYDIVIPNYFDLDQFEYQEEKEDYFLFLGRVYSGKGVHIAEQVCKAAGVKLKVAGQLDSSYENYEWPDHVEFVGYAGVEERKKLMKNAKGSFLASQYLEPFGGVQVENLLAGTPTISSDWGAFTENNIEGVTGYRCRTFEDYVRAVKNVQKGKIKSADCRAHGEKFSLEAIAPMYEDFFRKVSDIHSGDGWYEMWDESLYSNDYLKVKKAKKPKIAFWTSGEWALGQIYKSLQKLLSYKFDIDFYNWHNSDTSAALFTNGGWKEYDIIAGNTTLTWDPVKGGYLEKMPHDLLSKMAITVWAKPDPTNTFFIEKMVNLNGPIFSAPNYDILNKIKSEYNIDADYVKTGNIPNMFKPFKVVKSIKTLGMNGRPFVIADWDKVKRPEILIKIAELSDCKTKFISDSKETGSMIYKDIDMYVCTSVHDAGPAGIAECALAKIPVISTDTGYGKIMKSVKTFKTAAEAANIINQLNKSPKLLQEYVEEVYEEFLKEYNLEENAIKYWVPFFKKRLSLNNS